VNKGRAVAAMTFAVGVIIANNYYAQPLEAALSRYFDVPSSAVGAVLTLIQLSYALGLATLVPLGDLLERRKLVVGMLAVTVAGLVVVALAPTLTVLAAAAGLAALTTVAAQILVPFAASIAEPGEQGKTVSTVMSGLLIGILVSRVVAGLVAEVVGWRGVFVLGAVLTAVAAVALWRTLPVVAPSTSLPYPRLLLSVLQLVREEPTLRFRMIMGATGYASFGVLWTSIGFLLAAPPFRLSEATIGLFALFGVAGAVSARFAGRLADQGRGFAATGAFMAVTALGWVALWFGHASLVALAIGLVVFDLGVQGSHISNQNAIYALHPEARSRLNTAYMTSYFLGGALGGGLSSLLYASHGWAGVSIAGAAFPTLGFLVWLSRIRRSAGVVSA
jgi:predicted MFS family arabinose efflux permease